jgi:hypothetical protein
MLGTGFTLADHLVPVPEEAKSAFQFLAACAWAYLCFNVWTDNPNAAIARTRVAYKEPLVLATTVVACMVCNRSRHIFCRALATLVIPAVTIREIGSHKSRQYFLAVHLFVYLCSFQIEYCEAWCQGLAALLIQDAMMLDHSKTADSTRDGYTALAKVVDVLFDGYLLLARDGLIVGADPKAEFLLALRLPAEPGAHKPHFHDLRLPSQPRSTGFVAVGLQQEVLRSGDGSYFTAELCTILWYPQEDVKVLNCRRKSSDYSGGPIFLRCVRVVETLLEPPAPNGSEIDEEMDSASTVGISWTEERSPSAKYAAATAFEVPKSRSVRGNYAKSLPTISEDSFAACSPHRLSIGGQVDSLLKFMQFPPAEMTAFRKDKVRRARLKYLGTTRDSAEAAFRDVLERTTVKLAVFFDLQNASRANGGPLVSF